MKKKMCSLKITRTFFADAVSHHHRLCMHPTNLNSENHESMNTFPHCLQMFRAYVNACLADERAELAHQATPTKPCPSLFVCIVNVENASSWLRFLLRVQLSLPLDLQETELDEGNKSQ